MIKLISLLCISFALLACEDNQSYNGPHGCPSELELNIDQFLTIGFPLIVNDTIEWFHFTANPDSTIDSSGISIDRFYPCETLNGNQVCQKAEGRGWSRDGRNIYLTDYNGSKFFEGYLCQITDSKVMIQTNLKNWETETFFKVNENTILIDKYTDSPYDQVYPDTTYKDTSSIDD